MRTLFQDYVAQAIIGGASLLLGAILLIAGVGFLAASAYLALCVLMAPPVAALVTGLCSLVVALLVIVIGRRSAKRSGVSENPGNKTPPAAVSRDFQRLMADLGLLAGEEIATFVRSHRHGALTLSLLAGLALGASPNLRKTLRELADL